MDQIIDKASSIPVIFKCLIAIGPSNVYSETFGQGLRQGRVGSIEE